MFYFHPIANAPVVGRGIGLGSIQKINQPAAEPRPIFPDGQICTVTGNDYGKTRPNPVPAELSDLIDFEGIKAFPFEPRF